MKRSPIRAVSKKRQAEQRKRTKMLRETFGRTPSCRRCGRLADDAHEVLSRARGGSITDPENIVPLCRPCHDEITSHPEWATEQGWMASGPRVGGAL